MCLKLAEELGLVIASPWISWFKAASLPAFISLLLTPYILYKIYPPETKDTPDAPAVAAKRLEAMGPVTTNEWVMIATMILAVSLWVLGYVIFDSSSFYFADLTFHFVYPGHFLSEHIEASLK